MRACSVEKYTGGVEGSEGSRGKHHISAKAWRYERAWSIQNVFDEAHCVSGNSTFCIVR